MILECKELHIVKYTGHFLAFDFRQLAAVARPSAWQVITEWESRTVRHPRPAVAANFDPAQRLIRQLSLTRRRCAPTSPLTARLPLPYSILAARDYFHVPADMGAEQRPSGP